MLPKKIRTFLGKRKTKAEIKSLKGEQRKWIEELIRIKHYPPVAKNLLEIFKRKKKK